MYTIIPDKENFYFANFKRNKVRHRIFLICLSHLSPYDIPTISENSSNSMRVWKIADANFV